jgi:hypothetical protein
MRLKGYVRPSLRIGPVSVGEIDAYRINSLAGLLAIPPSSPMHTNEV